jgi:Asp-tRNA(Asn)/Glu-tRNA(Gln) amidotransferase A subunit family amidase
MLLRRRSTKSIKTLLLEKMYWAALAGVVFGIKDMLCTKGMPSTAGSKILQGFVPALRRHSRSIDSKNAGAVILRKIKPR